MSGRFRGLKSAEDMISLVNEIGFLPLFHMGVEDFSVEALTPGQWWTGEADDPWGWRETAANGGDVVYAKLFAGHAGFVSREWYPRLANHRRDGYDFDARWEEGLATPRARDIMRAVESAGGMLACDLKKAVGPAGFAGALSQLQTQTYLVIRRFGHRNDRFGKPYGWSIGEYHTPEEAFGAEWAQSRYSEAPEESLRAIAQHLRALLPSAEEEALVRLIR